MMKNPGGGKDKRVVNCTRACPDIGKTKRSDDTGILRQMRFIVPNETGGAKARIDQEDQEQEHDRAKQTHPPLNNTRFTEGHVSLITFALRFCQRHVRFERWMT